MPLLALLAALTAAPAAAAPTALVPASCLHASSGTAPSSLDELRACQIQARAAAVAAAASKGTPLTDARLEIIDESQRAEARKFLAQPQNVVSGPPESTSKSAAGQAASGDASGKLGGVTRANLGRVDPKSGAAIEGLQSRLHAAAGDGKNGVTQAMAGDIQATLIQAQGSVSPDMQNLLDAVSHDGGKLTPDTMKKLQGAGKAAKGEGLDLNIDPAAEKLLLERDFDADKPAFDAQRPPDSM
jgi:hypothetical protein